MDNLRTNFIVLFLGHTHLLEGVQGSKERPTNPDTSFTLRGRRGCNGNVRSIAIVSKRNNFLAETLWQTVEQGVATREEDVVVESGTDVGITLHDGIIYLLMYTTLFHINESGVEEGFRAAETFVANFESLMIRQAVFLLDGRGGSCLLLLFLEVKSYIAERLLDVTDRVTVGDTAEVGSTSKRSICMYRVRSFPPSLRRMVA